MAKVLNNVLCSAMVFLLTFAWTVYCLQNWKLALSLAAFVTLCAAYVIYQLLKRVETKRETKKKFKKTMADFAAFLQFNSDNSALFMPMFCYYNYITKHLDFDNIIIEKDKRILAAVCFQTETVNLAQIQSAVVLAKREKCAELMIFGNGASGNLLKLANSQIPTKFVDTANTYALFEHADKLPTVPDLNAQKQHFLPQFAFSKKRFWWYFFGAAYNLALSFFSFFKLYLLIWATVMFCLAVYSIANKRYNKTPTDIKLE